MKYCQNSPLIRHAIFSIHSLSGSVVVSQTLPMVWTNPLLHPNM
nr:protochlorophyllide reductase subunit B [Gelsemium elegans]YP_010449813.1 protochlorophyllide reductase subunit B [Gelsemium sempervirens]UTU96299.1 protochlorophyllide reductase subunit B [Gelsemium elegans]UTU96386.1 protochlorophyllide reductase subunit B [Gelsemium sempervirens]